MRVMTSHRWKPPVYFGVTLGAVVIVLALAFGLARLVHPGFTLKGLGKLEGRITLLVGGGLAYGTVVATTRLLKRHFGREFGTYLDDVDHDLAEIGPGEDKRCPRCGTRFHAYHNDAHREGFCSQPCLDAYSKRKRAQPSGPSVEKD